MSMIRASAHFDMLAQRIAARTQALAQTVASAQLKSRALRQSGDETAWRKPALIWPLFAKE